MTTHPTLRDPKIQSILAQPFRRFSAAEFARRRQGLTAAAAKHECDAILVCGVDRVGTGVCWLTGWPTSAAAIVLFMPGRQDVLFVEHYNHVPNARQIALDAEVRWAERGGMRAPAAELKRRGARRVGIMGLLTWSHSRQLSDFQLLDLNEDYGWLRMRKSDEEIDWMRIGAAFSDLGVEALLRDG
jgi:Xaa-Pro aminopeptidase